MLFDSKDHTTYFKSTKKIVKSNLRCLKCILGSNIIEVEGIISQKNKATFHEERGVVFKTNPVEILRDKTKQQEESMGLRPVSFGITKSKRKKKIIQEE